MPAGRPKGAKTNKIWADALRKAALDFETGTKTRRIELAAKSVVRKLIEGEMTAVREFGDRIDGKVPQALTDAAGGPITVKIVA